ncbi:Tyrosinase ustQ [Paramyrothecium foliicola]|nr:Tyrosinase ustQ [Paramyrothecium foliicola]
MLSMTSYWDETADATLSSLTDADIFQADAFGGDGVGTGRENPIADGPFVNTTLHLKRLGVEPEDYKIYRSLNVRSLSGAEQSSLDACFEITTYESVWECWHGSPHNSGHGGVGGLMVDVVLSPGDPVFFLHHGWLDAMWWKWQSLDLPSRLTDIGGRNVPTARYISNGNLETPGPEWTEHFGDEGNTTTLNHVLYAAGIYANTTVGDVMDVGGDVVVANLMEHVNGNPSLAPRKHSDGNYIVQPPILITASLVYAAQVYLSIFLSGSGCLNEDVAAIIRLKLVTGICIESASAVCQAPVGANIEDATWD